MTYYKLTCRNRYWCWLGKKKPKCYIYMQSWNHRQNILVSFIITCVTIDGWLTFSFIINLFVTLRHIVFVTIYWRHFVRVKRFYYHFISKYRIDEFRVIYLLRGPFSIIVPKLCWYLQSRVLFQTTGKSYLSVKILPSSVQMLCNFLMFEVWTIFYESHSKL